MTPVRLEPAALRSRVKHSTTEPLRSHIETGMCLLTSSFLNVLLFWFPAGQVLKKVGLSTFFLKLVKISYDYE